MENQEKCLNQPEESLDLEVGVKYIYSLVNEMDLHHCSRMTQKIKTYMEETLFDEQKQIKPTRLNYLKKLVEDVYYGEYLQYKNLKQPNRKDIN